MLRQLRTFGMLATIVIGVFVAFACDHKHMPLTPDPPVASTPTPAAPVIPLSVPSDRWIGMTSFRLLELTAHGHAADAEQTIQWASSQGVTMLRVLATAVNLFRLTTPDGYKALPSLCQAAAGAGVHLEIVALADTNGWDFGQLKNQVGEIGSIVASSCAGDRIEVANEPYHPTQSPLLASAATLRSLADLIPGSVPTALGAPQDDTSLIYAGRDYSTVHTARLNGIDGVLHLFDVARVWSGHEPIDDEPIGADETDAPGARDSNPDDFRARGALDAVLGLGSTFHCQSCLQSVIPTGQQLACFKAWREGLDAIVTRPGMAPPSPGQGPLGPGVNHCAALSDSQWATVACVGDAAAADPVLASGWTIQNRQTWTNLRVLVLSHEATS